MHPQHGRALGQGEQRGGERAGVPPGRYGLASQGADKPFARHPDQDRQPERPQPGQAAQQGDRVLRVLGEAKAGIKDQPRAGDAGALGRRDPLAQLGSDLGGDIAITGVRGHGRGVAARVHQHHGAVTPGQKRRRVRVVRQGGDVVDDGCAVVEGRRHGGRVPGVDRDDDPGAGQRRDHGQDARLFLVGLDRRGAGPRALPSDIHDVRPSGPHRQAGGDGRAGVGVGAAVAEAVGRQVEDAHNTRRVEDETSGVHSSLSLRKRGRGSG
jgi:hypothetical protein